MWCEALPGDAPLVTITNQNGYAGHVCGTAGMVMGLEFIAWTSIVWGVGNWETMLSDHQSQLCKGIRW